MIKAHELHALAAQGYRFYHDHWTPERIEGAAKYDLGNHLDLPEKFIVAGHEASQKGALRLPHPEVIFEFDTPDQDFDRIALLCHEVKGEDGVTVVCSPAFGQSGRWSEFVLAVLCKPDGELDYERAEYLDRPEPEAEEIAEHLQSMAFCLMAGAVAALESGEATVEAVPAPDGLNAKRARDGKPPVFAHRRVGFVGPKMIQ